MNRTKAFIIMLCLASMAFATKGDWVTIKNGDLWYDTEGKVVQAHGAGFL